MLFKELLNMLDCELSVEIENETSVMTVDWWLSNYGGKLQRKDYLEAAVVYIAPVDEGSIYVELKR